MSGLPIIDELRAAASRAERAAWLLRVPLGILVRDHVAIRTVLVEHQDWSLRDALDAELAMLWSTRDGKGYLTQNMQVSVCWHRSVLAEAARRMEMAE